MNKMTVRDIDVAGKKVLVRVDFNVPVDEKGAITDDSRIRAAVPTIRYLLEQHSSVILMSHFGRPKGKVVASMRLKPMAERLAQILKQPVITVPDCIGPEAQKTAAALIPGEVLMLENLRFHNEEEAGDPAFARSLASLGEIYVNDAFGTSHRAHASMSVIAQYLPAVAGFLLEKEVDTLGGLLEDPAHPFTSLFGGAKVSDKVAVLQNIMDKVDCLLIGGGMAATFLKAKGLAVGRSLVEADTLEIAGELIKTAAAKNIKLLLPSDVVIAPKPDRGAVEETVDIVKMPADKMILDIGPKTIKAFKKELERSKTIFWNGPMGVEEIPQFAKGTEEIARMLPGLKARTVLGGGSTAEVMDKLGLTAKVTFVSTGGGASLEFLGGQQLPGVAALLDKR
jgi:phosphoglycerate kinase